MTWHDAQATGLSGNSLVKRVSKEMYRTGKKAGLSDKQTRIAAVVLGVLALPLAPAVVPAAWPVVGGAYLWSKQRDENEVEFAKMKAAEAAYASGVAADEAELIQEQVEHASRVRASRRTLAENVHANRQWAEFAGRRGFDVTEDFAELVDLAAAGDEVEDVDTLAEYVEASFDAAERIRAAVRVAAQGGEA